MANSNTITGKFLGANKPKSYGQNNYQVQSFFVDNSNSPEYQSTPEFQLTGNYIGMVDTIQKGQEVVVHFNIEGRKWEKDGRRGVITNLKAWKVEVVQKSVQPKPVQAQAPAPVAYQPPTAPAFSQHPDDRDLPF